MENLFINEKGLDLLRTLRFGQSGYDPLFEEPTNFIEQTNQCFTYLVCLEAVEHLLKQYSDKSFYVNFGTEAGHDVESADGEIICECFSATAPDSNKKLAKDVANCWMKLNERVYENTGKMMEKYNVVNTGLTAGGGEYPAQDGFGWTNGVYLDLEKWLEGDA